jgi:DNA-binding MarR family transcriptional regulator
MVESNQAGVPLPPDAPVSAAVAAFRDLATSLDLLDQVAAARLGIARSDLRCLDVLGRRGTLSAGELARAVGLSTPALSAALRRLENQGYVLREHDHRDRRAVRISPTETAAAAAGPLFSQVHAASTVVLATLGPAEISAITRVTSALADAIQDIASAGATMP